MIGRQKVGECGSTMYVCDGEVGWSCSGALPLYQYQYYYRGYEPARLPPPPFNPMGTHTAGDSHKNIEPPLFIRRLLL